MMYRVERTMPVSAAKLWEQLADLTHVTSDDPYHDQHEWMGKKRTGVGTRFRCHHHYAPIFPFRADTVECEVLEWIEGTRQVIFEKNEREYRSHTQFYEVEATGNDSCRLVYCVEYSSVPTWIYPWYLYTKWLILRRMRRKCWEFEQRALNRPFDKQLF